MNSILNYLIPDNERKYTKGDLSDYDAIAAIIKDEDNRILIQKHNKYGFWTVPVGKVEQGESIDFALKKEIKEECNVDILDYKLLVKKNTR